MPDETLHPDVAEEQAERRQPEQPVISPAQFPPPHVEETYPAAVIQVGQGQFQGSEAVILTVVAPDSHGVVVTRHYPMSEKFATALEGQIREARGSKIEIVGADALPKDARA